MGDRANIYIHEGDEPGVYLYTHWSGYELPEVARLALVRGQSRWDDPPYLARIVFCQMIGGDADGLTGYGISAVVGDGDDRVVDIDTKAGAVTLKAYGEATGPTPFIEYVAQSSVGWSADD
jgi:hypothetical protein